MIVRELGASVEERLEAAIERRGEGRSVDRTLEAKLEPFASTRRRRALLGEETPVARRAEREADPGFGSHREILVRRPAARAVVAATRARV